MRVILKTDIAKLGKEGDIVDVSPGYARNYLIPKGIALPATKENLKIWEESKKVEKRREEKIKKRLSEIEKKLLETKISIKKPAGSKGKLFGAVTSSDIASSLSGLGIPIDKKSILIEHPIKEVGSYKVPVKLTSERVLELEIEVIGESQSGR